MTSDNCMCNYVIYTSKLYLYVGALNQLARDLACEWASDNIRANSVAPWVTATSLVQKVN